MVVIESGLRFAILRVQAEALPIENCTNRDEPERGKAGIDTRGCADVNGSTSTLLAYQSMVAEMLKLSSQPAFDSTPILDDLIDRYQNETGTVGKRFSYCLAGIL